MEYHLEKEREFIWLTQGDMCILQYETKFSKLFIFAFDFVQTEVAKCRRFQGSLQLAIKLG